MKTMNLYIGGTNGINFRYEINKRSGQQFDVGIFIISNVDHIYIGRKQVVNVTVTDVIDECLSHYKKKSKLMKSLLTIASEKIKNMYI